MPIPEPTQNTEIRVKEKMPLIYKILEKFVPKTSNSAVISTSNIEIDIEYYDVFGNDEEKEFDALDEEENEDLW